MRRVSLILSILIAVLIQCDARLGFWEAVGQQATCGTNRCNQSFDCSIGCFCPSVQPAGGALCIADTACVGVKCTGPGSCGTGTCFCSSYGTCTAHSACDNVKCSSPGSCGTSCFCSSYGTCTATNKCAGVRCISPDACGPDCACRDNVCVSNAPETCAGAICDPEVPSSCSASCFCAASRKCVKEDECSGVSCTYGNNDECGTKCTCLESGVCGTAPPPSTAFIDVLKELNSTMISMVASVAESFVTQDLELPTFVFSPEASVSMDDQTCQNENPPSDAVDAIHGIGEGLIQTVQGVARSADTSNVAMAETASQHITTVDTALNSINGISSSTVGGFGFGFGLQVVCGSTTVWGFGGGAGGGTGREGVGNGYGLGAGGGVESDAAHQIGGGASCLCSGETCECQPEPDSGSVPIYQMAAVVASKCPAGESVALCVTGGGGGGITAVSGSPICDWGGGFSMSYQTLLKTGSSSSSRSGESIPECNSGSGPGPGVPGAVARSCNAKCLLAPGGVPANYNSCFCPCFKTGMQSSGATWANKIACPGQTGAQ